MEIPIGASATPSNVFKALAHMAVILCAYLYMASTLRYDWECALCVGYPFAVQTINRGWIRTKWVGAKEYRHTAEVIKWAIISLSAFVFVIYWAGVVDQHNDSAVYLLLVYAGSVVASSD